MSLQHTIKAVIRQGKQSGFVTECVEIPVVSAFLYRLKNIKPAQ